MKALPKHAAVGLHSVPHLQHPPGELALYTGHLAETAAQARYGVAYLRSISSQAGVMMSETDPDEDAIAIDCTLYIGGAAALVQVKCTTQFKIRGNSASWPMDPHWYDSWSHMMLPVYFVLVVLDERKRADWLQHSDNGTQHRAAAYWSRVDALQRSNRVRIDKTQRLTTQTFYTWERDIASCFSRRSAIPNAG